MIAYHSHNLIYTSFLLKGWENVLLNLGVKGLRPGQTVLQSRASSASSQENHFILIVWLRPFTAQSANSNKTTWQEFAWVGRGGKPGSIWTKILAWSNSGQLEPTQAKWVAKRYPTWTKLKTWLELGAPFGHPLGSSWEHRSATHLARVGSTVWPPAWLELGAPFGHPLGSSWEHRSAKAQFTLKAARFARLSWGDLSLWRQTQEYSLTMPPLPRAVRYCSALSQSSFVRQKMIAWSILCWLIALTR